MSLYKRNGEKLTDLVVSRTFTKTNTTSFPANSNTKSNISITIPSGYKVLTAVRAWSDGAVLTGNLSGITSSNEANLWWTNATNSASKPNKLSIEVLFIKQ